MASLVVSGDTSGAITIAAPSIAGTNTLTLPASTGTLVVTGGAQTIEFAAGTVSAPSITNSGDTNTGMFFPAADTIAFTEGGVEAMRIDSSGNVGIGTSSPATKLQVAGTTKIGVTGTNGELQLARTSDGATISTFLTDGTSGIINSAVSTTFQINTAEKMRITSAGQLLVGTTSWTGGGSNDSGIGIKTTSTSAGQFAFYVDNSSSSNILNVRCDGSTYNTTGVWGTISDQRLKENIVDATPKLDNLLQLKVRNFNFTSDENKTKQIGFVAQEIEQVFPSLVSEDAEGTKAVKTTVLLPMLVKAIQEQQQIINDLKARIETLENT